MKIGIVADTHGNLKGWQQAWEVLRGSDCIFHCGDLLYHGPRFKPGPDYDPKALAEAFNDCPVPLIIVRGNGDSEVDGLFIHRPIMSPYAYAVIEGVRFLATHGHREPLEQSIATAQKWGIDYLLTAHLHVPSVTRHGDVLHINPGTPTYPLAEDKALQRPTCAVIEGGEVRIVDVETGERVPV